MSNKAIKAVIEGRLQGVGYRASTQQQATKLNIKGYVRNSDGNEIEVIAQGEEENLEKFIQFLKEGTTRSEVEDVSVEWVEPEGDYFRFSINY
ncbi:acylphosphatase [Halobacteroides halobius DSM 5150]|uniref:acylphosphatase n=1 Tax=Halobacteroides halobius (strain ATCC 35273 / DSM 5150 / MD-1) TaxID=748449 RepID=L0KA93_HALHC|nr:acylphosphatase [Halobacteroides halobius]AGB41455.1 acylphosphatase [Halobacteroides halobius DSM 5150]